jgi:glycosyltransferase involved in cell wall biosynthesis
MPPHLEAGQRSSAAPAGRRSTQANLAVFPRSADGPKPLKVSVVIAAYNAATFVRETLDSVFTQTLSAIEVIVVDDGSTDRTPEILTSIDDQRLIVVRQENGGVSAARNTGLAAARAPYIVFLDADDLLLRDALYRMVVALDKAPERVASFAHYLRIAEDGAELSPGADLPLQTLPAEDTLRHLIAKNFIACGAICIRTDVARRIGGFNATLKWGEDWEFWCRLAALGDFAAMPNDIVLMYRQHRGSANFRLRNSPLRPNFKAIDAVYSNPAICRYFSSAEVKRRRRLAQIDAFWTAARNTYVRGGAAKFLTCLIIGALCYPDSVLRPELVYRFLRGLGRHKARPARTRTVS